MNRIQLFFAQSLAFLLLGCGAVQELASFEDSVSITLPQRTVDSEGSTVSVASWNVVYTDGISGGHKESVLAGSTIHAECRKNRVAAFLAWPDCSLCERPQGKGIPRPVGAVFPVNGELSSQNGFAASVLYALYEGNSSGDAKGTQDFLTRFNWEKFEELCLEASDDPWLLDKERIMRAISSGSFKKSDIRLDKNLR